MRHALFLAFAKGAEMKQIALLAFFMGLIIVQAPHEVAAKDKGGKSGGTHIKTPAAHSHGKAAGSHNKQKHHKRHTHHKHHQHHRQKLPIAGTPASSTADEGVGSYSYEGGDYIGKSVPKVAF